MPGAHRSYRLPPRLRDRRPAAARQGRQIAGVDPALVERARQGDEAALAALLRAARPQIRRHAERHCITDAEDATQEALWTVHRKLTSLRSVAAFPAWMLRIVARICLGIVAPLWRRIEELKEEEAVPNAIADEGRLDLANAVEALPDIYRLPMLMHYYQDRSVTDIATELGITESATKLRLHRARERLRARLTG